jgi:hypothetical protein
MQASTSGMNTLVSEPSFHWRQQAPRYLFSTALGDLLLCGFVLAHFPAPVPQLCVKQSR